MWAEGFSCLDGYLFGANCGQSGFFVQLSTWSSLVLLVGLVVGCVIAGRIAWSLVNLARRLM